jgi:hypothetical protein
MLLFWHRNFIIAGYKMNKKLFDVPILFLIFNRTDTTKKVFNEIRKIRPQKLFVVADGPRKDKPTDKVKCQQTRDIIKKVDWDCEVKTLFRDENLGCRKSVSSGISWFFDHVEEGIVLEDDTLPEQSFFEFCREMLEKYRNDERIGFVSGDNFSVAKKRTDYSYYFSLYPHVWGWATWRRVWKKYNEILTVWPEIRDGGWLNDVLKHKKSEKYFADIFEKVCKNAENAWSWELALVTFTNNYLSIHPSNNLVSNIGFGDESTHTKGAARSEYVQTSPIEFPLKHPPYVIRDSVADEYFQDHFLVPKTPFILAIWTKFLWPVAGKVKRFLFGLFKR